MIENVEQTLLFKKVYGCMLGGATGDALSNTGEDRQQLVDKVRQIYGIADRFVLNQDNPDDHLLFSSAMGQYTDDTRMKHLLCQAILNAKGMPRAGDLGHVLAAAYHQAANEDDAGMVEEYYFKAIWGRDKVIFSGEPTRGAVISNSPVGLVAACRPDEAYQAGFDLAFLPDGYAKTTAAIFAAAVAAAMHPRPAIDQVIEAAIESHLKFASRREGPRWHTQAWRYDTNVKLLREALKIARQEEDVLAVRAPLYQRLNSDHVVPQATQMLAVALAMFVAAEGDFRQTVIGCMTYDQNQINYAGVGGALAGAFHGIEAIPAGWLQPVIEANPEVDMHDLSLKMTRFIIQDYEKARAAYEALGKLL